MSWNDCGSRQERSTYKVSSAHETRRFLKIDIHSPGHLFKCPGKKSEKDEHWQDKKLYLRSKKKWEGWTLTRWKTIPKVRKQCGLELGWFFFLFFSLFLFLSYIRKTCISPETDLWVGWGIHSLCLLVSCLQAGTCCGCCNACAHLELACKIYIQRGETCWIRQGHEKIQSLNLRWFAHYTISVFF